MDKSESQGVLAPIAITMGCPAGIGPEIICMKGPRWQQELAAAADALQAGSLALVRTELLRLPFSGAERALLVLKDLAKGG